MPYDSVYSEKRPPGTLRTAWRKFYSDAPAMVGLYGCAGLALLCIFWRLDRALWYRSAISGLSATATLLVTLWRSLLFFWGLTIWGAMC